LGCDYAYNDTSGGHTGNLFGGVQEFPWLSEFKDSVKVSLVEAVQDDKAEDNVEKECILQPSQTPEEDSTSAKVLASSIALNPQDGHFFSEAVGDVTDEYASLLAQYPHLKQAFRLGQVHVNHALPSTGLLAKVVVANDGAVAWPEMTRIAVVAGPDYGFPHLPLAPLAPNEGAEIVMDLSVGHGQIGESSLSAWTLVDEFDQPFGALMLLEIVHI
jgi:hypothetical protein